MPRANANSCEEKVKLTLRKLGHAKCSYDRKPHEKEGKWLNDAIGEKVFEDEKMYRVCDRFMQRNIWSIDHARENPPSAYRTINPILLARLKSVWQEKKSPKSLVVQQKACNQAKWTAH